MSRVGGLLFEKVLDYNQEFLERETRYFFVLEFYLPNHSKPSAGVGFGFVLLVSLREMVEDESVGRHCQCGSKGGKKKKQEH